MDIGRDEARELAREELRDQVYDRDEPLSQRIVEWLIDRLNDLFDGVGGAVSTPPGLAVVIAAVVIAAAVIILRSGPLAVRSARAKRSVFGAERVGARDYRDRAEAAAADGNWSRAVVERFRAIVATAEERGVIDERPGRTADEAARDTGAQLHHLATRLTSAAQVFDAIRYGDQHGDRDAYTAMCDLDDAVTSAGTSSTGDDTVATTGPAVPR